MFQFIEKIKTIYAYRYIPFLKFLCNIGIVGFVVVKKKMIKYLIFNFYMLNIIFHFIFSIINFSFNWSEDNIFITILFIKYYIFKSIIENSHI